MILITLVMLFVISIHIPHKSNYNLSWHSRVLGTILIFYLPFLVIKFIIKTIINMDKLFELLQQQPALSIVLGFILALVLVIILKDQIRKKFTDYYSLEEVKIALVKTFNSNNITTKRTTTESIDKFLQNLKHK